MLDDLTKTVKAQLYERIGSPLLGPFLFSWCAWNYKFILVLISSLEPPKKFELIQSAIYTTDVDVWLNGVAFPLSTALAYIFFLPWVDRAVFWYVRSRQNEMKHLQSELDKENPMLPEEAAELRIAATKAKNEFDAELKKRDEELSRTKTAYAVELESAKRAYDLRISEESRKNEELQRDIMEAQQANSSLQESFKVFRATILARDVSIRLSSEESNKASPIRFVTMLPHYKRLEVNFSKGGSIIETKSYSLPDDIDEDLDSRTAGVVTEILADAAKLSLPQGSTAELLLQ